VCVCLFVCGFIFVGVCVYLKGRGGRHFEFCSCNIHTCLGWTCACAATRVCAQKNFSLLTISFGWFAAVAHVWGSARVAAHAHAYAAFRLTRVVIRVSAPNTNWERRRLRERFFLFVRLVWRIFFSRLCV